MVLPNFRWLRPTQSLCGIDGDRQLLADVIGVFLESLPDTIHRIESAIHEQRAKELERVAHSLKGELLALGIPSIAKLAKDLESAGRDYKLDGTQELFVSLQTQVLGLREPLMEFCNEHHAK